MLRSLKSLEHYKIRVPGELGKVVNFLLDDERWIVRYLIVETGGFLDGRAPYWAGERPVESPNRQRHPRI